jgi:hypothetical protein
MRMTKETAHCYVFDTLADWEHGFAVAGINNTQFHRVRATRASTSRQPVIAGAHSMKMSPR